jgi:hypothetical protein
VKGGPVETFLHELARQLRSDREAGPGRIAEISDHLRDLVAEGRARGLDEIAAEQSAVERFGSPRELARNLRVKRRTSPLVRSIAAVAVLGACGGLAIAESRAPRASARGDRATIVGRGTLRVTLGQRVLFHPAGDRGPTVERSYVVMDPRSGRVLLRQTRPLAAGAAGMALMVAIDPRTGRVVARTPLRG